MPPCELVKYVGVVILVTLVGCREPDDSFAPLDVSEVKCTQHRAAAGLPACLYALEQFLVGRVDRIVQVVAVDDGTDSTERLFVVHTRSDPKWPAASDMIVAPLSRPIEDKRQIVITLRSGGESRMYLVRPMETKARAHEQATPRD